MKIQKMLLVVSGLVTVVAFQNCGQGDYNVNPMAAQNLVDGQTNGTILSDDQLLDQVPSNDVAHQEPLVERMPSDESSVVPPVAPAPGTPAPDKSQVIDDSLDQISDEEIMQMCEKNKQHQRQMKVLSESVLKDRSGHSMFLFNQLDLVENISGKTMLQGQGDRRAVIHLIQKVSGTTYVCNADVILVSRSSGRLVVVGGKVTNVDGFSGNLRIVQGELLNPPTHSSGVIIVNEQRVH